MGKKLMLVIVAAALGIIVGAGFADALDDNRILSGGKAAGMDGGSKEPPFRQMQMTNAILKNGMRAEIKDNRMFIIGADGKQSPAKNGTYELTDGKKITVRNGIATIGEGTGWNDGGITRK